jgi:hypothetical protein
MPSHRLDIEKIPLILRPPLHPKIIPKQKIKRSRHTDYSGQSYNGTLPPEQSSRGGTHAWHNK